VAHREWITDLLVKDTRDGEIYRIAAFFSEPLALVNEATEFRLVNVLTGVEKMGSEELLLTYFVAVSEMEVLAWVAKQ